MQNQSNCGITFDTRLKSALKTIEKFKSPELKVVGVAYQRWPLTRDYDYSDLTRRNVIGILERRSFTYERWSHMEDQLNLFSS